MASYESSASHQAMAVEQLTYSCDDNDVAIFSRPHYREDRFDNVHIGEEVDLEDLVHQANGPATLSQLFHGPDNRCFSSVLRPHHTIARPTHLRSPHKATHRSAQTPRPPLQQQPDTAQQH
jgi:hypothetical protein